MDEIKKEEQPTTDSGTGDKPQKTTLIDDANIAAQRLEDANKEKEGLLNREEELAAKRRLGGQTEAGTQPPKEVEESAEDYSARALRGDIHE